MREHSNSCQTCYKSIVTPNNYDSYENLSRQQRNDFGQHSIDPKIDYIHENSGIMTKNRIDYISLLLTLLENASINHNCNFSQEEVSIEHYHNL